MTTPPYALPLRIRKAAESFIVEDAGGGALAYVYFEDEPTRRSLVNRLSGADAKAVGWHELRHHDLNELDCL
ncbi:MAG: hypothetical protein AB7U61_05620 [Methylocystis sp.]